VKKIKAAPKFPVQQYPIVCERNAACVERIVLSKLAENGRAQTTPTPRKVSPDRCFLDIRFYFDECPSDDHIKSLATHLKAMVRRKELEAKRITWAGLKQCERSLVKEAVEQFWKPLRRRARSVVGGSPTGSPSPHSGQQTLQPPTSPIALESRLDNGGPFEEEQSLSIAVPDGNAVINPPATTPEESKRIHMNIPTRHHERLEFEAWHPED
jgi:hypothetical protein